jgi:hypothetical protein
MRNHLTLTVATMLGIALFVGCASRHEEGVKSDIRTQWTSVNADTKATADAAEAVLRDEGLMNVKSRSTNVDGMASGMKADKTEVKVDIEKKGDMSQVSVTVGMMGSPSYGAELAKKIKMRAEGGTTRTTETGGGMR